MCEWVGGCVTAGNQLALFERNFFKFLTTNEMADIVIFIMKPKSI